MRALTLLVIGGTLIGACASTPTPKPLGKQNLAVDARPVQRDNEPVTSTIDMQASGEGVTMRRNEPPPKKPTPTKPGGETAGELQLQENPVVPPPPETALGH